MGNLLSYPTVAAALAAGTLSLHGWAYDMRTGSLSVYDADKLVFIPASSVLESN